MSWTSPEAPASPTPISRVSTAGAAPRHPTAFENRGLSCVPCVVIVDSGVSSAGLRAALTGGPGTWETFTEVGSSVLLP